MDTYHLMIKRTIITKMKAFEPTTLQTITKGKVSGKKHKIHLH